MELAKIGKKHWNLVPIMLKIKLMNTVKKKRNECLTLSKNEFS